MLSLLLLNRLGPNMLNLFLSPKKIKTQRSTRLQFINSLGPNTPNLFYSLQKKKKNERFTILHFINSLGPNTLNLPLPPHKRKREKRYAQFFILYVLKEYTKDFYLMILPIHIPSGNQWRSIRKIYFSYWFQLKRKLIEKKLFKGQTILIEH